MREKDGGRLARRFVPRGQKAILFDVGAYSWGSANVSRIDSITASATPPPDNFPDYMYSDILILPSTRAPLGYQATHDIGRDHHVNSSR